MSEYTWPVVRHFDVSHVLRCLCNIICCTPNVNFWSSFFFFAIDIYLLFAVERNPFVTRAVDLFVPISVNRCVSDMLGKLMQQL